MKRLVQSALLFSLCLLSLPSPAFAQSTNPPDQFYAFNACVENIQYSLSPTYGATIPELINQYYNSETMPERAIDDGSYVIVQSDKQATAAENSPTLQHDVYYTNGTNKIQFGEDEGAIFIYSTGTMYSVQIRTAKDVPPAEGATGAYTQPVNSAGKSFYPPNTPINLHSTTYCSVAATNVLYDSDFHYAHFRETLPTDVIVGSDTCDTLDVGCWIGKIGGIIEGIGNGIANAISVIFRFLFVPNSANLQQRIDSISQLWNQKLGFLATINSKLLSIFNMFINPNTGNCTTSGCFHNFGTMFGSPFSVDFATVAKTMPSVWSYTTMLIRGITIIALFFALRRKLFSVMQDRA